MPSPALDAVDFGWSAPISTDSLSLDSVDFTWHVPSSIPDIVADVDPAVVFHTAKHSSTAEAIPAISTRVKASTVFTSEEHSSQIGAVGGRLSVRQSASGTIVFSTGLHSMSGTAANTDSFVVHRSDVVSYGAPSLRLAAGAESHDVFHSGAHSARASSAAAAAAEVVQHAQHAALMAVRPWPAGSVARFGLPSIARNEL